MYLSGIHIGLILSSPFEYQTIIVSYSVQNLALKGYDMRSYHPNLKDILKVI